MAGKKQPIEDRFWKKVEKTQTCWNWLGCKNQGGYGQITSHWNNEIGRSSYIPAHRFAYELLKGKIPKNLVLDHLCRNRGCVNPDHLEAVTDRINILRGEGPCAKHARKTHCLNGHALLKENIYYYDKQRICKICHAERAKKYVSTNPERLVAYVKKNRKKISEYHREWRQKNKEHLRIYGQKRKAMKKGLPLNPLM